MARFSASQRRLDIRANADELILRLAHKAADDGDLDRFDELMARLPSSPPADPVRDVSTMDYWRVLITLVMIAGLIAIIFYASLSDSPDAGQYVSLFSGLAGISIGWLFGSGSASALAKAVSAPE